MEDIRPILTLEDLREALDLSHVQTEDLPKRFEKIAKALLTEFAIKKGDQLFYITDIEFYYFTNSHKDFITYPRKCEAGEWFFHPSGVDLAFKSNVKFEFVDKKKSDKYKQYKPVLDSIAEFGGILIRSIEPAEGTEIEGDPKRLIDHPLNVSDFLFDHFNALESDKSFPILIESPHLEELQELPKPCPRYIKIADMDKKFENILKYNYSPSTKEPQDLRDKFKYFLTKKLRYTITLPDTRP